MKKVNYQSRKKKKIAVDERKRLILSILLTTSISLSAIYGVVSGAKNLYKGAKDTYFYNKEAYKYYEILNDNSHITNDRKNIFINTFNLANDLKNLDIQDKEEFYHHLIGVAQHIKWNKDINFENLLEDLDLDELAKENSTFPTTQEFYDFLKTYNLLNEDGNIDFEAWEDYDKEVFSFENKMKGK